MASTESKRPNTRTLGLVRRVRMDRLASLSSSRRLLSLHWAMKASSSAPSLPLASPSVSLSTCDLLLMWPSVPKMDLRAVRTALSHLFLLAVSNDLASAMTPFTPVDRPESKLAGGSLRSAWAGPFILSKAGILMAASIWEWRYSSSSVRSGWSLSRR
jgi:hypothetical protein